MKTNPHAAWRLEVAGRVAREYAPNSKVAALAVAGSVGAGVADRFSDLELDCYWFSAPDDSDRTGPIEAAGGELDALWDYDEDDLASWRARAGQFPASLVTALVAGSLTGQILSRAHTDADISDFPGALSQRRPAIDPPGSGGPEVPLAAR